MENQLVQGSPLALPRPPLLLLLEIQLQNGTVQTLTLGGGCSAQVCCSGERVGGRRMEASGPMHCYHGNSPFEYVTARGGGGVGEG